MEKFVPLQHGADLTHRFIHRVKNLLTSKIDMSEIAKRMKPRKANDPSAEEKLGRARNLNLFVKAMKKQSGIEGWESCRMTAPV